MHRKLYINMIIHRIVVLFFLLGLPFSSLAQSKTYYFYNPELKYGSEFYFNPASTFINGGFDILRNGGHTKDITDQAYKRSAQNVWENISQPLQSIEQYGWKYFISEEIFPLGIDKDESQYIPNYLHHMLGGGMLYVKMAEWYDYHRVPYPRLTSAITSLLYHFLNETLENHGYVGNNTDPIADLLIFNPLGILLFSSTSVKKFFSQRLQFYDWSLQPLYNPLNHHIENAGQQFVMFHKAPFTEKYSVFYYYGIYGIAGLSYQCKSDDHISFGAGLVVNKLEENMRRESRFLTPKLDGALGLFYDRNRSLLWSMLITGPKMYNARLNIYPGIFRIGWFHPGFYLAAGEWDKFMVGVTVAHIPIGLMSGIE
jgi:hypothetical protein